MYSPSSSMYSSLFIFIHLWLHCIRLSRHFHSSSSSLPATIFITYNHQQRLSCSPLLSIAFNVIVSSTHLHRHSTHRHYRFHWSSSLPFSFILSPPLFLLIVSSGALFITWIDNWTVKTHTIFSITRTGNYTRHTTSSGSRELVTIQDTQHLQDHRNW